jgi:hypothetical protein
MRLENNRPCSETFGREPQKKKKPEKEKEQKKSQDTQPGNTKRTPYFQWGKKRNSPKKEGIDRP